MFRTLDGTCNNMKGEPLRGASYRPYTRLLPTIYDNEVSEPVGELSDYLACSLYSKCELLQDPCSLMHVHHLVRLHED